MADKDLEKKIAEAKANGYTDEEIQAYLNPQPVPVQEPKDRSEEYIGTGEFGLGKAAQTALELGGAYYGGKKLLQAAGNAFRGAPTAPPAGPVAPTVTPTPATPPAPTTFTGGANPAWDEALKKPYNPAAPQGAPSTPAQPPVGGPAAQQGSTFLQRFGQQLGQMRQAVTPVLEGAVDYAAKAAPVARVATGIGAMVMPGNVGQNYPFPQKGPMRGSEINPTTGRPWTPQELATYNQQY